MATDYANWFATHEMVGNKWRKKKTASATVGAKPPAAPAAPAAPQPERNQMKAPDPQAAAHAAQTAGKPSLADDAQAAAARAQALFDATSKRAAVVAAGSYDANDLEEAIRRLLLQRPDEENQAKNAANAVGLFGSSTLTKNLGDIATKYVRGEADARQAYGRRQAEREGQLAELDQSGLLSESAIDAALADRQAQRDADAAAANALVTVPVGFHTGGAAAPGSSPLVAANSIKPGKQPAEALDKAVREYLAAQAGARKVKKTNKKKSAKQSGGAMAPGR